MSTATQNWTAQQTGIFSWFATGRGNLVVRARAGTGKTTTIIEGIDHAPEKRILLAAFNKRIADELKTRIKNPNAEAATLHSIGFRFVRKFWNIGVDSSGKRKEMLARAVCGNAPDAIVALVAKLHTLGREINPLARRMGDLTDLLYAFECDPDPMYNEYGFDAARVEQLALAAMELAATSKPAAGIDFADMIFLPVRNGWLRPTYSLVVVDEAQDMNAAQLLIARGISSGRIAVVGDDRQAIYGFRGADSGAIDRLKTELHADELGLTTTFRCGKKIVAEANTIVPDFFAAETNHDGEVTHASAKDLPAIVEPGDFVLSRSNAPLAKAAMKILQAGKRCRIEGRDIGAGLIALVRKLSRKAATLPAFEEALSAWCDREVARYSASTNQAAQAKVEKVADQTETIRVLSEGLATVAELITRIEGLFSDNGHDGRSVVCSSVHKAKGLEAERVFVLADTFFKSSNQEEDNIKYVAITRAKRVLTWVR